MRNNLVLCLDNSFTIFEAKDFSPARVTVSVQISAAKLTESK